MIQVLIQPFNGENHAQLNDQDYQKKVLFRVNNQLTIVLKVSDWKEFSSLRIIIFNHHKTKHIVNPTFDKISADFRNLIESLLSGSRCSTTNHRSHNIDQAEG